MVKRRHSDEHSWQGHNYGHIKEKNTIVEHAYKNKNRTGNRRYVNHLIKIVTLYFLILRQR